MIFMMLVFLMSFKVQWDVIREENRTYEKAVSALDDYHQRCEGPPKVLMPSTPEHNLAEYERLVPQSTRDIVASEGVSIADKLELYMKNTSTKGIERLISIVSRDTVFSFLGTPYTYTVKDLEDVLAKRKRPEEPEPIIRESASQEDREMWKTLMSRGILVTLASEDISIADKVELYFKGVYNITDLETLFAKRQQAYEMIPVSDNSVVEDAKRCCANDVCRDIMHHNAFSFDGMSVEKMDHLVATLGHDRYYNGHSGKSYSKNDIEKLLRGIRCDEEKKEDPDEFFGLEPPCVKECLTNPNWLDANRHFLIWNRHRTKSVLADGKEQFLTCNAISATDCHMLHESLHGIDENINFLSIDERLKGGHKLRKDANDIDDFYQYDLGFAKPVCRTVCNDETPKSCMRDCSYLPRLRRGDSTITLEEFDDSENTRIGPCIDHKKLNWILGAGVPRKSNEEIARERYMRLLGIEPGTVYAKDFNAFATWLSQACPCENTKNNADWLHCVKQCPMAQKISSIFNPNH